MSLTNAPALIVVGLCVVGVAFETAVLVGFVADVRGLPASHVRRALRELSHRMRNATWSWRSVPAIGRAMLRPLCHAVTLVVAAAGLVVAVVGLLEYLPAVPEVIEACVAASVGGAMLGCAVRSPVRRLRNHLGGWAAVAVAMAIAISGVSTVAARASAFDPYRIRLAGTSYPLVRPICLRGSAAFSVRVAVTVDIAGTIRARTPDHEVEAKAEQLASCDPRVEVEWRDRWVHPKDLFRLDGVRYPKHWSVTDPMSVHVIAFISAPGGGGHFLVARADGSAWPLELVQLDKLLP